MDKFPQGVDTAPTNPIDQDPSPLIACAGRVPVEMLGDSLFPPIGQLPYLLTLPPYGFYWFLRETFLGPKR